MSVTPPLDGLKEGFPSSFAAYPKGNPCLGGKGREQSYE
jgi:hypothetical protein